MAKHHKLSPNQPDFLDKNPIFLNLPPEHHAFFTTVLQNDIDSLGNEYRFIMVGNMIDKHYYGEEKEIKSGTKHFRAGAKLFLFPEFGGMGHIRIPVYGMARKTKRMIIVTIRSCLIKNVRVQKTYDPKLIALIQESFFYKKIKMSGIESESLARFAESINSSHIEIE